MLSPCIRQVPHALLTRPPLKQNSLGFLLFPFDLHVLSTPPAFILSQDQTLMFFRSLLPVSFPLASSDFFQSVLLFLGRSFYRSLCSLKSLFSGFSSSEAFFRLLPWFSLCFEFSGLHYCLFVKVLCFRFPFRSAASLSGNSDRVSYVSRFVNSFFYFFLTSFFLTRWNLMLSHHLVTCQ